MLILARSGLLLASLGLMAGTVAAQLPGEVARPAPAEAAPLGPPGATPPVGGPRDTIPPAPSVTQPSPPAPPPAAQPGAGQPTLVPNGGDPMSVDEVMLPGKPAAVLRGTSTWDEGFANLKGAFRRIDEELRSAGLAPAGRPLTVFTETDDLGFRYEAMVPIAAIPEGRATLTPEIRFGRTPQGKALRFVHKAPYEDMDSTYETITAYLDAKGLVVEDAFIEEYAGELKEPADPTEINVFVQPKG